MKKRVWNDVTWYHSVSRYSGSRYVRYGDMRLGYAEFHYDRLRRQYCKSIYYIT